MKKYALSIVITFFILNLFSQDNNQGGLEQIYSFRIIAFHKKYDFYCTMNPKGYYRFPAAYGEATIYLTYETREFYNQCFFDENITLLSRFYPTTMWTNRAGEVYRLKKRYAPVIERDREGTGHKYGIAEDFKPE